MRGGEIVQQNAPVALAQDDMKMKNDREELSYGGDFHGGRCYTNLFLAVKQVGQYILVFCTNPTK